jgi:hypothetical protein
VFAFGEAPFLGSAAGRYLPGPVVDLEPTPSGRGYWLVTASGWVQPFGDAAWHGSLPPLDGDAVVGMASTPTGRGYWLATGDGRVFSFGDAIVSGGTGAVTAALGSGLNLRAPIVEMAATPSGPGYWLVALDGGVFAFGAPFRGSVPQRVPAYNGAVALLPSEGGDGYYIAGRDAAVFAFGDADARRELAPRPRESSIVDIALHPTARRVAARRGRGGSAITSPASPGRATGAPPPRRP